MLFNLEKNADIFVEVFVAC